jgi:AraC family transcriptional regulator
MFDDPLTCDPRVFACGSTSRVGTLAMMSAHAIRAHLVRCDCYGRIVAFRESAGVRLSEVGTTRPARLPSHTHEGACFWLILSGICRERYGAEDHWHRPFSMGYCPPGFEHRIEIGRSGARFFVVELTAERAVTIGNLEGAPGMVPTPLQGPKVFRVLLRLHGEFCRIRDTGGAMDARLVDSLTAALIAQAVEPRTVPERGRPHWLEPVVAYIDAHYADAVRVRTLAAGAGVHRVHLARVFRQVYGCSIGQYQALLRIRQACRLFHADALTLAQIATMTGFADQSHFTRTFTSIAGYPPGAFRRSVFPHVSCVREASSRLQIRSARAHMLKADHAAAILT